MENAQRFSLNAILLERAAERKRVKPKRENFCLHLLELSGFLPRRSYDEVRWYVFSYLFFASTYKINHFIYVRSLRGVCEDTICVNQLPRENVRFLCVNNLEK